MVDSSNFKSPKSAMGFGPYDDAVDVFSLNQSQRKKKNENQLIFFRSENHIILCSYHLESFAEIIL